MEADGAMHAPDAMHAPVRATGATGELDAMTHAPDATGETGVMTHAPDAMHALARATDVTHETGGQGISARGGAPPEADADPRDRESKAVAVASLDRPAWSRPRLPSAASLKHMNTSFEDKCNNFEVCP